MYTNHSKLSDDFCSIKISVDLNHFAHDQIQADLFMAQVTAAAKELVLKEYGRLYQVPHSFSETHKQKKCDLSESTTLVSKTTVESPTSPKIKPKDDSGFNLRERLPNSNVVDIASLTVEKAVTENSLVRCPFCGQAHCLAVNSGNHIYFMARNYDSNQFDIVSEYDSLTNDLFLDICRKDLQGYLTYYDLIRQLPFKENIDFAVENNTEIFCPVCHGSNPFIDWKDAFENPLKYFETESLCDACGGERIEKVTKKSKTENSKTVLECERCGLAVPGGPKKG